MIETNDIPFFFKAMSGLKVKYFPFINVRCSLILDQLNDLSEVFRKVFLVFPFVESPSKCRISITSTNSSKEYEISSNSCWSLTFSFLLEKCIGFPASYQNLSLYSSWWIPCFYIESKIWDTSLDYNNIFLPLIL